MANDRHKRAVEQKALNKDDCGYDWRLDSVGAIPQFSHFIKSTEGEAIFKAGKLEAPPSLHSASSDTHVADPTGKPFPTDSNADRNPQTDGMCSRKRCKTHTGWYNIHVRHAHFQIRQLAREAKERLDTETRVRNCAAVRYFRKKHEPDFVATITRYGPNGVPIKA